MSDVLNIKKSKIILALSLISLTITIFFGVIGWKFQNLDIGLYFGISLVGFSALVVVFALLIFERIGDVEANIKQEIREYEIASLPSKTRLLNSQFNNSSRIEAFINQDFYQEFFSPIKSQNSLLWKKTKLHSYSTITDRSKVFFLRSQHPTPLFAIFIFNNATDLPNKVILVPNDSKYLELPWLFHIGETLTVSLYRNYMEIIGDSSLDPRDAISETWLQRKADILTNQYVHDWKNLKDHKVFFSTPLDIYKEQIALSDGAKYIHAFDMTDIDEWFDHGNLGACLTANIGSAKDNNEEISGNLRIRRVFLAPSRRHLESNKEYKRKLVEVIKEHQQNNIGVGLVFQDEMRNKEHIQDFVVYNREVVWVETVPTTRQSGAGYFSTKKGDIEKYMMTFEDVWNYKYPRSPNEEACELIRVT